MVTLQSLLITAVVLAALGLIVGAGLYWRDNKTKVDAAIWRVLTLFGRMITALFAGVVYLFTASMVVIGGFFSLTYRILAGTAPFKVSVKVSFDE